MDIGDYQQSLLGEEERIIPPSVRGSQTSRAAALSVEGEPSDNARRRVLQVIFRMGPLTDEEISELLGMNPSTARPRRVELERMGLIFKAGTKKTKSGRDAIKWVALKGEP